MDRLLEECRSGPLHWSRPEIAPVVVGALGYGQDTLRSYTLHALVVMPNHVHVLLTPHVAVPKLRRTLKAFTARRANPILGSTGKPFWQDESYDHLVRNEEEWQAAGLEAGCGPGGPPH